MKLQIQNIDQLLNFKEETITSLHIENTKLFATTAQAFALKKQYNPICQFSWWNNDKQLSDKDYEVIIDPFNLPFLDKLITKQMALYVEQTLREDSEKNSEIYKSVLNINNHIDSLFRQTDSYFVSSYNVDIKKIVNMLQFKPEYNSYDALLDNLINYLNLLNDLDLIKPIVFIGLKKFLSNNELKLFYEHLISKKIIVLMLDGGTHLNKLKHEDVILVDQDFFESNL